MVRVPSDSNEEERFFEVAIESGAEDVTAVDNYWEVTCDPQVMSDVVTAIKDADFTVESNEIVRVPSTTVKIDDVAMKNVFGHFLMMVSSLPFILPSTLFSTVPFIPDNQPITISSVRSA